MKPKKTVSGPWNQGIYDISAEATEIVGTVREDLRGNKYAYSRAGAANLAVAIATVAADLDTDVLDCNMAAAAAIGDTTVDITVTSTTVAKDYFRGGDFLVNDGTGEGHRYMIIHSSAVAAGTAITLTLDDPIRVALATGGTSQVSLIQSPYMGTVISAIDQADLFTGVPMAAVTATYYYWSQIAGIAAVWQDEAVAKGAAVTIGSATAGQTEAVDLIGEAQIGIQMQTGVIAEYQPVKLG